MPFKMMYESDFYRIEADMDGNMLRAKWLRPIDEQEMKTGGVKLYEVLRDTGVERAMANAQAFGTLSPGAKEWMSTAFYELLSQTKLKRLARVMPDNLFYRIALESVATRADALGVTHFEVKNFPNEQEALAWLRSVSYSVTP